MGRFKKWSAAAAAVLICFLEVFGQPIQGAWRQNEGEERQEPDFSLHAQSAVLLDGDTGRILYGKNENELRPMASTTKAIHFPSGEKLGELTYLNCRKESGWICFLATMICLLFIS